MHALEQLQRNLAIATELTENFGDHGRIGIYKAMLALIDYLAGQGMPRATLYPLQVVAGAVVDADRAVTTLAFKADTASSRPPLSLLEHQPRALRAVVVECCIRAAKQAGEKAFRAKGGETAQRMLKRAGWRPVATARQLLQLREEETSRPRGEPMRDAYEELLRSDFVDADPLRWAGVLLDHGWVNQVPKGQQG